MSERIARIRIALNDIETEILRRVEVPLDLNLKSLHDVMQAVMAWQDYHLFEFIIDEKGLWSARSRVRRRTQNPQGQAGKA